MTENGRDQQKVSVLRRWPSYRGVSLIEVSIKRELTVCTKRRILIIFLNSWFPIFQTNFHSPRILLRLWNFDLESLDFLNQSLFSMEIWEIKRVCTGSTDRTMVWGRGGGGRGHMLNYEKNWVGPCIAYLNVRLSLGHVTVICCVSKCEQICNSPLKKAGGKSNLHFEIYNNIQGKGTCKIKHTAENDFQNLHRSI